MTVPSVRASPELVTVIVPVLNGERTLGAQLRALSEQTYDRDWEVLVVDNGSDDGTADVARSWGWRIPSLRIVEAPDPRGLNHARNAGASAARGDLLVYGDADDAATPGWVAAMAEAARRFDIVGGFLDDEPLNDRTTRVWRVPQPRDRLPTALGFLPYAVGANLGIWADVLWSLGGWNRSYLGGGDEVELCWRAQLAGRRLGFAPNAVMRYRYRPGLGALARQVYGYGLAEPRLYRDFRHAGVPKRRLRGAVRSWGWIFLHAPYLLSSAERSGVWVRRAAFSWGCLRGSLRYRVLCL